MRACLPACLLGQEVRSALVGAGRCGQAARASGARCLFVKFPLGARARIRLITRRCRRSGGGGHFLMNWLPPTGLNSVSGASGFASICLGDARGARTCLLAARRADGKRKVTSSLAPGAPRAGRPFCYAGAIVSPSFTKISLPVGAAPIT